jgi:hypothetical protein
LRESLFFVSVVIASVTFIFIWIMLVGPMKGRKNLRSGLHDLCDSGDGAAVYCVYRGNDHGAFPLINFHELLIWQNLLCFIQDI